MERSNGIYIYTHIYTPPTCVMMSLPFVSRCFCRRRAENGALDPSLLDLRLGAPDFAPETLRLTFPRAKLRRQIFLTGRNPGRRIGRKIGRNFGRNFLGIFALHSLYRTTHQNFSPNSSQFITPCLATAPVTAISKFHLRELLGLGVPNETLQIRFLGASGLKTAAPQTQIQRQRIQHPIVSLLRQNLPPPLGRPKIQTVVLDHGLSLLSRFFKDRLD